MRLVRVLVATLVGTVVIAVQAGFLFGFLLADFFASSVPPEGAGAYRTQVNYPLIVAADFIYAGMLAVLFTTVARVRGFRAGAVAGAILGFGLILHVDLLYAATTFLNTPASIAANVAASTLMSGVAGGVIAFVLGAFETERASS